ncbi:CPBP family intramembrane glutamic endopeptidase [Chryseobacterium herbae]|uniref:CPBP family intramembrane metalloprotease n=1 Tax=Chryseobacterium herbae TaxID=2976476 RepID=A0ABT2IW41_9FLAO|nr:CPBP family intramembrane glutamic endopeptidase [Chryseobacterium sp. pc1-10]MCT2563063.1 CPBP family intramembrane metalloprotease [Chryseobacterium sp. pc1-10]
MNKIISFFFFFVLGFFVYYFLDLFYFKTIQTFVRELSGSKALAHVAAYSVTMIPLIITLKILFPKKNMADLFSINKSVLKGFNLAFIGTLPMLAGYLINFSLTDRIDIQSLFINTISSAFFEELIFRAFLIGILYRFSRLGFITSALFGSFLFAQVHLYQGSTGTEIIEIFLITFFGSVFFSWVYFEMDFNLWAAIFLHILMNLYWEIFNVSENVSGNLYGNSFKILSILLIIAIIIYRKYNNKVLFRITPKTLFTKTKTA